MYNTDVADGVIPPTVTQLTCYFLRLGAIGFGGPVALAARMHRELVEERGWVGQQEYLEGLAFAQLAPGPLAAQLAMYLGFTRRGAVGCTAAGAAFVLPSFLAVLAIASAYRTYGGLPLVRSLFYGIGPAAIGVMAIAAGRLAAKTIRGDRVLLALFGVAALWTSMAQQEVLAVFVAAGVVNAAVRTGRTGGLAPTPLSCSARRRRPGPQPCLHSSRRRGCSCSGAGLRSCHSCIVAWSSNATG